MHMERVTWSKFEARAGLGPTRKRRYGDLVIPETGRAGRVWDPPNCFYFLFLPI